MLINFKNPSLLLLRLPRKTITMAENSRPQKPKRPTCPTCSKPSRLCLCVRIKTKQLDNSIAVTVLQHSLEQKHPLNSARIALLGLKNATLSTVSDVRFEARFEIRLSESETELGLVGDDNAHQLFVKCPEVKVTGFVDHDGKTDLESSEACRNEKFDDCEVTTTNGQRGVVITAKIGKRGVISNLSHTWTSQNRPEKEKPDSGTLLGIQSARGALSKGLVAKKFRNRPENLKPDFDTILGNQSAREALSKGFVVKKFQTRQRDGSSELEEYTEYEINVPRGSILLFPSERAISVDDIKADTSFEVKNLVVLDGTWAKANRIYAENPWLKVLPHLKLDVDKTSLYNGVRNQPKVGCLSTIESIVYALKALETSGGCGDNVNDGLDELLSVFESMVDDQKECKEKRLRMASY